MHGTVMDACWRGLKYHDDGSETDLGYRFLRRRWGKGYATEALA